MGASRPSTQGTLSPSSDEQENYLIAVARLEEDLAHSFEKGCEEAWPGKLAWSPALSNLSSAGKLDREAEGGIIRFLRARRRRRASSPVGGEGFRSNWSHARKSRKKARICLSDLMRFGLNKVGAWRSLVARLPWAQEVPGSNPGAPTNILKA